MRLTLRTLLAYMDDILEPAQAREIGQKLKESELGRQLLEKIREVVRRRRITAPELDGPESGLDPNTVAEYLDNNLAPEGVADVERVCLESDIHLAEVAACHQILTLVLGDPIEVPERTRERMYALAPSQSSPEPIPTRPTTSSTNGNVRRDPATGDDSFQERIPEYLRRTPTWRRVLPFAIVGGIAAAWLALIVFDPSLGGFGSAQPAPNEGPAGESGVAVVAPDGDSDPVANPPGNAGNEPPGVPIAAVEQGNSADRLPPDEGINPPPPDVEPGLPDERKPPIEVAVVPRPDGPVQPVQPMPMPPVEPVKPAVDDDPNGKNPGAPAEPAGPVAIPRTVYTSKSGILMTMRSPTPTGFIKANGEVEPIPPGDEGSEDFPRDEWGLVEHGATFDRSSTVACPLPFEATLEVDGGVRTRLMGGSRIALRPVAAGAHVALALEEGRVWLDRLPSPDAPQEAVVALTLGSRNFAIVLETPETSLGVALTPLRTSGYEQAVSGDRYSAMLYLLSGRVRVVSLDRAPRPNGDRDADRSVVLTEVDSRLSLRASDWPTGADLDAESLPEPLVSVALPDWLSDDRTALSSVFRRARLQFERQFEEIEGETTVAEMIEPVTKDADPTISEFATQCLALTRDARGLANALATSPHPESRTAAIIGLRSWMAEHEVPEVTAGLQVLLSRYYSDETADVVYRLLWGFDLDDARDRRISERLVEWLGSDEETIRHLAFYHVQRMTGRDYEYQPHEAAIRRMAAIRRWVQHVQDNGALVASPVD